MLVKLVVRSRGNSHVARLYDWMGTQKCVYTSQTFRTKREAHEAALAYVNSNRYRIKAEDFH